MRARAYAVTATAVSAAGTAFSGYLSATRLQSGVCAFDEACPLFLGHPACYVGFGLFAALLVVSGVALATRTRSGWPAAINAAVATLGVLFAARMTAVDLASGGQRPLILPTCAWGFVFFAAMLVVSLTVSIRPMELTHSGHLRA